MGDFVRTIHDDDDVPVLDDDGDDLVPATAASKRSAPAAAMNGRKGAPPSKGQALDGAKGKKARDKGKKGTQGALMAPAKTAAAPVPAANDMNPTFLFAADATFDGGWDLSSVLDSAATKGRTVMHSRSHRAAEDTPMAQHSRACSPVLAGPRHGATAPRRHADTATG